MESFADDPRRTAIDETVTSWPNVKAKQVFGHRAWMRGRTMFGFVADDGVAVKLIAPIDRDEVLARDGAALFTYNGEPSKNWAVLPVRDDAEMDAALDLVHTAYEAVAG